MKRRKNLFCNCWKLTYIGENEDTGSISIEQYNKEIDEALAEVEAGNYITQEEMEKQAAKW